MIKKILITLLLGVFTISGIFAYMSPSVILNATENESQYTFKLQKLNADMTDYTDIDGGEAVEDVILSEVAQTTNAYTVATANKGNLLNNITFEATVTTGEFVDSNTSTQTGLYPELIELSDSATTENQNLGSEVVNLESQTAGDFSSQAIATFRTTFDSGLHLIGVEIARFKLEYKSNGNLAAGSYTSTTTIEISTV